MSLLVSTDEHYALRPTAIQIHASLSEWKTGFHKKSSFPADGFLDAYNEHHTVLEGIKKSNLGAYHFMMHWLFQEAR